MRPEEEKVLGLKQLWHTCFPEDSVEYVDYWFQHRYQEENALIHWEDGKIVSALHIIRYDIRLCQSTIPCGFIVGVATLPEYRKRGYVRILMQRALQRLKEDGVLLTGLSPFQFDFYRAFGYEAVSEMLCVKFQSGDFLRMFEGSGWPDQARPFERKDIGSMQALYQSQMQGYNGYVVRQDIGLRIDEHLVDGKIMVAQKDGKTTGYALYAESEEQCEIAEMVFSDIMCMGSMLHAISKEEEGKKVICMLPGGTETGFLPEKEQTVNPYIMMRLVDPAHFKLKVANTPDTLGPLFRLKDEFLMENTGDYQVKIAEGMLSFSRCERKGDQVCDIKGLSAAVFGYANREVENNAILRWILEQTGKQNNLIYEKY